MADQPIQLPNMCETHQWLLVTQCGVGPDGPWRSLIISVQVVLFQMVSCDDKAHARVDGDITRFGELGCLGCLHPDYFGEAVQAAQSPDPHALKDLGERYIAASGAKRGDS